jgi:CheY-like chemotaxis protein
MDCQMPGMDGHEATQALRLMPKVPVGTPIIAVTANTTGANLQRCLESGMTDFLGKPVDIAQLQDAVARHGRRSHTTIIAGDRNPTTPA